MNLTTSVMAGTLVASTATIASLIHDLKVNEARVDETLNEINFTHLAAMLYVLKNKNPEIKIKEETKMAKTHKIRTSTKVAGAATLLLAIVTGILMVKDHNEISEIEGELMELEPVAALEGASETIGNAADDLLGD